jgi:uncharacterized membrane protein YdjX (TVP38/TMEM64 family)
MRLFLTQLLLLLLVLLVPMVPFLLFGAQLEAWLEAWRSSPPATAVTVLTVIGLLAGDIVLPVPSSLIITLAGAQLGVVGGTLAAWVGMSLGAVIGFALARRWGPAFAQRLAGPDDLQRVRAVSDTYGPLALVVLRGAPVLAEASVLLLGIHRLTWRRFLPPVLLANLGVAMAYALFGRIADQHGWLPTALGVSLALPLLLTAGSRRWWARRSGDGASRGT